MNAVVERKDLPPAEPVANTSLLQAIQTAALNPEIDVEKMERLLNIAIKVRGLDAEQAYAIAMNEVQSKIKRVVANADNTHTGSRYATYAKLDGYLRPIYSPAGFSIEFGTEPVESREFVRVVATVTHNAGHSRKFSIDMPADGKGAKGGDVMTKTHATGAATQYGMRYLLKMIFNVAFVDKDDDGNGADPKTSKPAAPKDYDKWQADMNACADNGTAALQKAWGGSKAPFRTYVVKHDEQWWTDLKAKAAKVTT